MATRGSGSKENVGRKKTPYITKTLYKRGVPEEIYTNGEMLLKPHFSGYFFMVDCTEYKTKKQIKSEYDKETAKQLLAEEPFTYEGVKYFECEYSPHNTENMELLSDVSELEIINDEYDF